MRRPAAGAQGRGVALAGRLAARAAKDSAGAQLVTRAARGSAGRCGIAPFLTLQSGEWLERRFASLRLSITAVSIGDSAGGTPSKPVGTTPVARPRGPASGSTSQRAGRGVRRAEGLPEASRAGGGRRGHVAPLARRPGAELPQLITSHRSITQSQLSQRCAAASLGGGAAASLAGGLAPSQSACALARGGGARPGRHAEGFAARPKLLRPS